MPAEFQTSVTAVEGDQQLLHPAAAGVTSRRIALDVSDLILWVKQFKTVSGIQRVDVELIRYALDAFEAEELVYCITDYPYCMAYREVPESAFRALLANLHEAHRFTTEEWQKHVIESFDPNHLNELKLGFGDTLVIPGAFWTHERITFLLNEIRPAGVRLAIYVYDLIPIFQPEYCSEELVRCFGLTFTKMSFYPDVILTISEFAAEQVARFYREAGRDPVPIIPVPLAQDTAEKGSVRGRATFPPHIERILREPYVLCVGTIEARKNHAYLFRIWQALLGRHGPFAIPRLIWVGRKGWQVDDLFSQMAATHCLNGHLIPLHGLSDLELGRLYDDCLFTAFPSFSEGWGLPVGESLSHGKVCVASSATSLPEVGGPNAVYCDPLNMRDGYEKIERLIFDSSYRAGLEQAIASLKLRTWTDVGRDFFSHVRFPIPDPSQPPTVAPAHQLPYGSRVTMSVPGQGPAVSTDLPSRLAPPLEVYLGHGWLHDIETDGGVWSNGKRSNLRFSLPLTRGEPPDQTFRLYIEFWLPPWHDGALLRVAIGKKGVRELSVRAGRFIAVFDCIGKTLADRRDFSVDFLLQSDAPPTPPEARWLGIGVVSLAIARKSDIVARTRLVEQFGSLL